MINKIIAIYLAILTNPLAFAGGLASFYVKEIKSGVVTCEYVPSITCEVSAAQFLKGDDGRDYILAFNDKESKSSSPFIRYSGADDFSIVFEKNIDIKNKIFASKFEAMTKLYDGTIVASTAFNYKEKNNFKKIISISSEMNIEEVKLIQNESMNIADIHSEISLLLSKHLNKNIDYIKIEGLAEYGGKWLYFGVREAGESFDEKDYKSIILKCDYTIDDGLVRISNLELDSDLTEIFSRSIGLSVGLSSIEINPDDKKMYLLTTFEATKVDGNTPFKSYLWRVDMDSRGSIKKETIASAKNIDNSTFLYLHKAEGLTFGNGGLIVFHDDDREETPVLVDGVRMKRTINQSPYSVLKLIPYPRVRLMN